MTRLCEVKESKLAILEGKQCAYPCMELKYTQKRSRHVTQMWPHTFDVEKSNLRACITWWNTMAIPTMFHCFLKTGQKHCCIFLCYFKVLFIILLLIIIIILLSLAKLRMRELTCYSTNSCACYTRIATFHNRRIWHVAAVHLCNTCRHALIRSIRTMHGLSEWLKLGTTVYYFEIHFAFYITLVYSNYPMYKSYYAW